MSGQGCWRRHSALDCARVLRIRHVLHLSLSLSLSLSHLALAPLSRVTGRCAVLYVDVGRWQGDKARSNLAKFKTLLPASRSTPQGAVEARPAARPAASPAPDAASLVRADLQEVM